MIQAAERETLEETGVPVILDGILRVEHSPRLDGTARLRVVFLAHPQAEVSPKSAPDEESLGAGWFSLDELDDLVLCGAEVREILRYVQDGGNLPPDRDQTRRRSLERPMNDLEQACQRAAEAILAADALLIGAGAGMGVDSGLPDFRGPEGFWRAYPAFRGRRFEEISNPVWFQRDPEQAWGFFGHRLNLYRATAPHAGFEILRRWGESRPLGYFVFTSNVDGHFQRAGFSPEQRPGMPRLDPLPPVCGWLHGRDLVGGGHDRPGR